MYVPPPPKRACLKVYTSFGHAPLPKNEMKDLIINHVKEYVSINTW